MPTTPCPFTIRCLSCGWKKTSIPASDVMTEKDFPSVCPQCFNEELEKGAASAWDKAKAHSQSYALHAYRLLLKK